MIALAVREKMFYCPKCQQTYDDGSQRFCNNDGGRLLPVSDLPNSSKLPNSPKFSAPTTGVFTNLLGKIEPPVNNDEKLASLPRFVRSEHSSLPVYEVPVKSRFSENEPEVELELEPLTPNSSNNQPTLTEFAHIQEETSELLEMPPELETETFGIPVEKPRTEIFEIPIKPVSRITYPTGRTASSGEKSHPLTGSLVKDRYLIAEHLEEDETSVSFLAADQQVEDRKVVVRVLMRDDSPDEFINKIYSEERISLAQVDHPNIAKVLDSGELPEGKQFVVTEFIQAESVAEVLKKSGQFNSLRTARIVRQIAYALSEAHQNGILHRNLKPENLLLDVSEAGTEQVKLTNFGVSGAVLGDLAYKAPEILEGKLATFAGDVFSLAVIAYQMLTNRLPFQGENAKELLKSQHAGLRVPPTNLRLDLSDTVDSVLEKAMAHQPIDRYPKVRDFGDAFFNALSAAPSRKNEANKDEVIEILPGKPKNEITLLPIEDSSTENSTEQLLDLGEIEVEKFEAKANDEDVLSIIGDLQTTPRAENKEQIIQEVAEVADAKNSDLTWTRRSPEPPKTTSKSLLLFSLLGLTFLLLALWGIWTYFLNRPMPTEVPAQVETPVQTQPTIAAVTPDISQNSTVSSDDLGEVPPISRQISQPPNTVFFQNSKQEAKGNLLKNFLSFSLYYPKDWKVSDVKEVEKAGTRGKFLDISRNNDGGTPIEKMLISYYESKGTFKADAENFPKLVKETNETLKKIVPNYQMLSEGEIKINGGWRAYEIKFQGGGDTANGEKITLWGRRLFIPMARPGMRSGYEITMFATSLSTEVKSIEDVGIKGELGTILETFEPNQNF
jgi:serine/threonine protein kinase